MIPIEPITEEMKDLSLKVQESLYASSPSHEDLDYLEVELVKFPEAIAEVMHHFQEGAYIREMRIAAGTALTGKIHSKRTFNIVAKGSMIITAFGETARIVSAGESFFSDPGSRRAGLALEDTVYMTVHITDETDHEKLEEELITKRENPMLDYNTRRIKL